MSPLAAWRRERVRSRAVADHGIEPGLIAAAFDSARAFYVLPLEERLKLRVRPAMLLNESLQAGTQAASPQVDAKGRGYTALGQWTGEDGDRTQPGDTKETYQLWQPDPAADSPQAQLPLHGPNQWPPEQLLPGFKAAVLKYDSAVAHLAARWALRVHASCLNLNPHRLMTDADNCVQAEEAHCIGRQPATSLL